MRFVLDAQLPPAIVNWLESKSGCACLHVSSSDFDGADDLTIFQRCRRPGTVIWTKDQDFADLVARLGHPPQIVWVRIGNCSNRRLREVLEGCFSRIADGLATGAPLVEVHSSSIDSGSRPGEA